MADNKKGGYLLNGNSANNSAIKNSLGSMLTVRV